MTCECCDKDRPPHGGYPGHTPACVYCGARLVQRIQRLPISANEKATRCRAVLADWLAHRHDEIQLRHLAKLPNLAYEPSESPINPKPKRRSP